VWIAELTGSAMALLLDFAMATIYQDRYLEWVLVMALVKMWVWG
jgi:hypothetical protein